MHFKIRPHGSDASMLTVTSRLSFRQDSLLHYLRLMFDRSDELAVIDYLENIDQAAIWKAGSIDIHLLKTDSLLYIGITDSCASEDKMQRFKDVYNEILVFGARTGIDVTGRPIVIYHRLDEEPTVFELGVPINEKVQVSGRIQYKTMQGREHLVANYFGAYDTLEDAHNAIQQWLTRHKRKTDGYPWEMYVTIPAAEPDTNKWLTRIYYPVE
jgi:effector-binding domain-containing protein